MLFDKRYVREVFPEEECDELFMKCMPQVYNSNEIMTYKGQFAESDLPESMKAIMAKDDTVSFMMHHPWAIRTYMSYTVYYLLAIDSDYIDSDMFLSCVLNTYDGIYDYENFGVYPTLRFETRDLTIEFYKAFYEFLLPILQFYTDNDVNRRADNINFSRKFKTLYKLYNDFGVDVYLDANVLYDTLVSFMNDVDENYERPIKNEVFY